LHQHTGAMRTAFLQERHRRGDDSDPFVEAERRAVAQRDAAAKRIVHPTLHLPAPQPTTPSAPSAPASTPGMFGATQTGIFQNQSATPPASQSLFGSTPTPTSNLFGSTTPTTAGASSSSLFGSAFASTTPAGMCFKCRRLLYCVTNFCALFSRV
jgi:nucleoporin p58/p45